MKILIQYKALVLQVENWGLERGSDLSEDTQKCPGHSPHRGPWGW